MKNIRIGNDINVIWTLVREEGNYPLDGLDVSLYLKSMFGREALTDFSVSENKVFWTFYGKDQSKIGRYSLELVINEGDKGMVTTDICDFVNLVNCSCKSDGFDDNNIVTETIELTSSIEFAPTVIQGGGGLKYSEERTVYLTKIDLFGEIEDTFEITEEQREYNRETVRLASDNEMPVTLNKGGQMFAPYTSGSSEARFIASYVDETETWSFTIFINDNGNAEGAWKVIPMGATKEELATLLEGFIPLSRDFSDDFNNDFAR
jgi:hypothetical protein